MKFRNDPFLLKIIVLLVVLWLAASTTGCATWTEEYWQEYYENMTPEEIEAAKAGGCELIPICNLTDCIFVCI